MKQSRVPLIIGLCVLSAWLVAADAVAWQATAEGVGSTVSRGRQILLNRGLQIEAATFTWDDCWSPDYSGVGRFLASDYSLWKTANFTTFNFWNRVDTPAHPSTAFPLFSAGQHWSKIWEGNWPPAPDYLTTAEKAHKNDLVRLQFSDEPGLRAPFAEWPAEVSLGQMATTYAIWKTLYPNTLAGTSADGLYGIGRTQANLAYYTQTTQPDLLLFNYNGGYTSTFPTFKNTWYSCLQKYRITALAGFTTSTGANSGPLPYGYSLNLYRASYGGEKPKESFIHMQQNVALAFGCTYLAGFEYNEPVGSTWSNGPYPVMFDAIRRPDANVFSYVADANRESRNLGPALTRMVSTGVFVTPGTGYAAPKSPDADTPVPNAWTSKGGAIPGVHDDYLTSVTPYTNSTANGGVPDFNYDDMVIGYFMPLLADNRDATFVNGLHFMIVNGAYSGTAEATAQWYHLVLDYSGSSCDSLVRLSRETGKVELVPLTYMGNSQYYLDLYLPGGDGDLFTFWRSDLPLPTIPEPDSLILAASGCLAALVWRVRRHRRYTRPWCWLNSTT
jgi:hypothetical protein